MDPKEIVVRSLLEVFNQTAESRRASAIRDLDTDGTVFYEMEERFSGCDAINHRVSEVLATLPPGVTLGPAGPSTTNHDLCRLPWTLNREGGPALASGMDVAILGQKPDFWLHGTVHQEPMDIKIMSDNRYSV